MIIRDDRREAAIELMADHLLRTGLAGARLRPLAAAAGTSDRMLLYYFEDRDALLAAVLERIAVRLTKRLDDALPADARRAPEALLTAVWSGLSSDQMQAFMHIWLDLAAAASRGAQPHTRIDGAIADGFLQWVTAHLEPQSDEPGAAAALLSSVEGLLLLKALGRPQIAQDAFEHMARSL
ncbi:TetR/AcrR family transcriptional regulator [soil metagenome]